MDEDSWYDDLMFRVFEKPCQVFLACTKEFMSEADVEFLDISESIRGEDLLTFGCPKCKMQHTSLRYG